MRVDSSLDCLHWFAVVLLIILLVQPVFADDKSLALIEVKEAWSPAAPPGMNVRAGYFTLTNHSHKPVTITGVKSPDFERVELHESLMQDGLMTMSAVNSIVLNAGESLQAKPGGMHLMLMQSKEPVTQTIPVVFLIEDAEPLYVELVVRSKAEADTAVHQPITDHSAHGHAHH